MEIIVYKNDGWYSKHEVEKVFETDEEYILYDDQGIVRTRINKSEIKSIEFH